MQSLHYSVLENELTVFVKVPQPGSEEPRIHSHASPGLYTCPFGSETNPAHPSFSLSDWRKKFPEQLGSEEDTLALDTIPPTLKSLVLWSGRRICIETVTCFVLGFPLFLFIKIAGPLALHFPRTGVGPRRGGQRAALPFSLPPHSLFLSISSCGYWSSECLLWRDACLGPLPMFQLDCLFLAVCVSLPWVKIWVHESNYDREKGARKYLWGQPEKGFNL